MESADQQHSRRYLLTLSLGALGVVYGDIGTSPLYAFKECFMDHHGRRLAPTPENVMGVLSLITWSLIIVISIKYLMFVMRADNRGEGGILALMSLMRAKRSKRHWLLVALGLFGSALLYGDGMITPAITMLSAMEGLNVVTSGLNPYVIPLTVVALVVLFAVQKNGTAKVGAMFGPIMAVWFTTLAGLGVYNIARDFQIVAAINPLYGIRFLLEHQLAGYLVLGAVFLVVTGGEALYADMGHFGVRPIRLAWFALVFPALLLNYFGQGALLLHNPKAAADPFFFMAPEWARLPLVILATVAAAIASQAVISGSFSLTRQAVQLGYLPRLRIRHTSARQIGQIYIPSVNWLLMFAAIGLVIGFGHSTRLAGAYGVAVTTTMGITTMLLAVVARERWHWSKATSWIFAIVFLVVDLAFFGANIIKVTDGGWFPLVVGLSIFSIMTTWRSGRIILNERLADSSVLTEEDFMHGLTSGGVHRVPGIAVFMSRRPDGIPTTFLHNIKHNKIVHNIVVFLTVDVEETAHLSTEERFEWRDLGNGVYRLVLRFGYMEEPNIPEQLSRLPPHPVVFNPMSTSYFLGRETLIPTKQPGMALWREHLFAWMMRNSTSASTFFSLPANQVIELGAQVEM